MAIITYPLTLPSLMSPQSITIRPESRVGSAPSTFTFQQQVQVHAGQRWSLQIVYPPMYLSDEPANAMEAFLTALNGREGTFLAGPMTTPRGVATGTPLVKGGAQTGNELITDGWTPGVTGILKANDWLQIGTGASARLYKVLKDVNSDGSGEATIPIWPNLRTSPANNAQIVTSNPVGVWRMVANEPDVSSDSLFLSVTINAREAL